MGIYEGLSPSTIAKVDQLEMAPVPLEIKGKEALTIVAALLASLEGWVGEEEGDKNTLALLDRYINTLMIVYTAVTLVSLGENEAIVGEISSMYDFLMEHRGELYPSAPPFHPEL